MEEQEHKFRAIVLGKTKGKVTPWGKEPVEANCHLTERNFIIETDKPGYKGFTLMHKMGMRAATTGRIELKDYRIPTSHQLGETGKGFRYAMATLDGARVGVAAQGVGIAQRALDESIK